MANRRQSVETSTKHRSKEEKERRKYEESLIKTGKEDLLSVTGLLDGKIARDEYNRLLNELEELDFIGNLDRANLVAYANAYAMYVRVHKKIRKSGFKFAIECSGGLKKNPLIAVAQDAYREMCRAGSEIGISLDARLKMAEEKRQEEEDELSEMFGDF